MKPKFALTLSFDGISLLHRAAGGWRLVGEVALDGPDLGAALAGLREKALKLEPGGITTKLVIPNEQIRYDTIERVPTDEIERDIMVRAALDGATPYPLDALAYDTTVEGGRLHIAVVARETLAEAEAFAVEHRFDPVSFVAIPGEHAFTGEPFFGPTEHARSLSGVDRVEADGIAVVVIGPAKIPGVAAEPEPVQVPPPAPEPQPEPEPLGDPVPPAEPDPPTPEELPGGGRPDEVPGPDLPPELPPDLPETAPGPVPGFSSRRRPGGAAPALSGAVRAPDLPAAPRFTPAPQLPDEGETDAPAASGVTAPSLPGTPRRKGGRKPATAAPAALGRFLSRRKPAAAAGAEAPEIALDAPRHNPLDVPPRDSDPLPVAPPPAMATAVPQDEARRMTVFGARDSGAVGGKPRHLGLILTALLLVFLAGVAAWAALFLDDGVAGLFQRDGETEIAALPEEEEATEPEPALSEAETDPAPAITDSAPARPEPEAPQEEAVAPAPVTDPAPAPEPAGEDIAALPSAPPDAPELTDTDSAVLDALRAPEEAEAPDAAADPAAPGPEDAAADYAATGIWDRAPARPDTPSVIPLGDLYVASIDRSDLSQDAVALQSPRELETDEPPTTLSSPASPETEFDLDPNGLVVPSPDGTVTPDGAVVYLGPPPVVPPPTPDRPDPQAETDELRERLAGFRPRLRPEGLVEGAERAALGGLTRNELADRRPRLRPDTLKVEDEVDETPTAQAVARSRAPRARPAALARQAAEAQRQEVAAVAPRTVTPRIPSSASVSRQATVRNAINLRDVNLIGVYGTPSNRRALVRLPSGRYKKVQVGDRIDGGRIVAIGDSELRYQKGGRNLTLTVPSG